MVEVCIASQLLGQASPDLLVMQRHLLASSLWCFGLQPPSPLTNDADFVKAVQKYKHVVTHYFAAKTEIWMALFMKEVYGVTGGNLSNEFAPSRGCIHFHSVLQAPNCALRLTAKELQKYAHDVAGILA